MGVSFWLQVMSNIVVSALVYVVIASGFTLLFGILRVFNFAHGHFFMLGLFAFYYLFEVAGLNYPLAAILSAALIGGLGALTERFFFRRVRGQHWPSAVMSIGLMLLLGGAALLGFGEREKSVTAPLVGTLDFFGAHISYQRLLVIIVGSLVMLALYFFVNRSNMGRAIRAVAQDRDAALLQGIDINRISMVTFAIGCALAAVAAFLMAPMVTIDTSAGLSAQLRTIVVVVLGGLGSIPGAVIGGFALAIVEGLGYTFAGGIANVFGFAFVLILLLIKPTGLMGALGEEE